MKSNVTDILGDLIQFNSVSSNSNLPMIDYIRDYLSNYDIKSTILTSADGTKGNLFATIGAEGIGGIALSAHTDVVPVDDKNWHTPPFELTFSNGLLYGRGTCDMKGFLACCLAMVAEMKMFPLKIPIHLVFSYDEEIGCLGVRHIIKKFGKDLPTPKIVWVGEPTEMKVVSGHKSFIEMSVHIKGLSCHSSIYNKGISAIKVAHDVITYIYSLQELAMKKTDKKYAIPYTGIHIGMISGGTASNIVAANCNFTLDIRGIPSDDTLIYYKKIVSWSDKYCKKEMQTIDKQSFITIKLRNKIPAFVCPVDSKARNFANKIIGTNEQEFASYVTEAGLFQESGIPTVLCGPGSIDQAHKDNEWINPDQLQRALYMIRCIIESCRLGNINF